MSSRKSDGFNPQDKKTGVFAASSLFNTPVLSDRFDRFCTTCSGVLENMALEKYPGQHCIRCKTEVEFLNSPDGAWRRCVRCSVFLRCTMKFCYLCGRPNNYFDPDKPARLEKKNKMQVREELKKEAYEKNEAQSLSQLCASDGKFSADDDNIGEDLKESAETKSNETLS